ncbi:IS30 family transposase, partial [Acinetobacter sp. 478810]
KKRKANGEPKKDSILQDIKTIHERPAEVQERKIPGHWEADLIKGKDNKSSIATLIERNTRLCILATLPDAKAESVRKALTEALKYLPAELRKTLTYDRGRVKKVYVQGDAGSRMMPEDLNKWYVRNNKGEMVPFSAFATGEWTYGSPRLERYNGVSSVNIQGTPAPGVSSGDSMKAMEEIIAKLPSMGLQGFDYEWTGLSLEERESGAQAPFLYALSLLIVFLCLAALYESWSIPFSVLLVVPLGIIGAIVLTYLGMIIKGDPNLSNNIYFQVAMIAVIGLSAKNAILIVEFAKELQEKGEDLIEATLHAAKMRLRPIIMTTLAFGFGVLPLALSTGAGAGSQHSVGYGVLGGVLSATFLGIFFIPVFYVWIRSIFKYKPKTINTQEHKS